MAERHDWIVINTRPRHQAAELSQALSAFGLDVREFPVLEIVPLKLELERFRAGLPFSVQPVLVVFTSANAVKVLSDYFQSTHAEAELAGLQQSVTVAVIGAKSRAAAEAGGFRVVFEATESNSIAFAKEFAAFAQATFSQVTGLQPARIILLRGQLANPELPEMLQKVAKEVQPFSIYETSERLFPATEIETLREMFSSQKKILTLFTSSEAVRVFSDLLISQRLVSVDTLLPAAVIGPETAETAIANGYEVVVQPLKPRAELLAQAVADYLKSL